MVFRGIIVWLRGSLNDGMKVEAWGDLDEWDVEHFGRHADMKLRGA